MEILQVAEEIKPRMIVMCKHSGAERGKMLGRTAMKVLQMLLVLWCWFRRSAVQRRGIFTMSWCRTMGHPAPARHCDLRQELAEHARAELLVAHVTDVRAAPAEPGSLSHTTLCRSATA